MSLSMCSNVLGLPACINKVKEYQNYLVTMQKITTTNVPICNSDQLRGLLLVDTSSCIRLLKEGAKEPGHAGPHV